MPPDRETSPPPRRAVAPPPPQQRPGLAQRAGPWIDLLGKLLAAIAAALAIWKALG
jgi:hypothetical protein